MSLPATVQRPQLWEHDTVTTVDLEHSIGDHEREGWEVAGIARHEMGSTDIFQKWTVVFKRRLE